MDKRDFSDDSRKKAENPKDNKAYSENNLEPKEFLSLYSLRIYSPGAVVLFGDVGQNPEIENYDEIGNYELTDEDLKIIAKQVGIITKKGIFLGIPKDKVVEDSEHKEPFHAWSLRLKSRQPKNTIYNNFITSFLEY
jgi:hypothetical protein